MWCYTNIWFNNWRFNEYILYYLLGGGSGPNVEVLVNKKEIKIRKGDKTMMKELYNIYILDLVIIVIYIKHKDQVDHLV